MYYILSCYLCVHISQLSLCYFSVSARDIMMKFSESIYARGQNTSQAHSCLLVWLYSKVKGGEESRILPFRKSSV